MLNQQRMSRRTLLKLAGASTAMAVLNVTKWPMPSLASEAIRSEWTFREGLPSAGVFETPVLTPDTRFDAVDVGWVSDARDGQGLYVEVRTQFKDGSWSDWSELHFDSHSQTDESSRFFAAPVLRTGNALQVRVTIDEGTGLRELTVGTLDTSSGGDAAADGCWRFDRWLHHPACRLGR